MGISASDVIPLSHARANFSELAEEVRAGIRVAVIDCGHISTITCANGDRLTADQAHACRCSSGLSRTWNSRRKSRCHSLPCAPGRSHRIGGRRPRASSAFQEA